jgi:hypothetical protein
LRYFLKGILVKNHGFLVLITLLWFQIGLFSCGQRTHVSLEENPVCYDVQHPAHCSPVIIEIIFEGYISGKSEFSRRRKPQFVISRLNQLEDKLMYMSKENHLCSKRQHLVHGFPVRSELVFASNASMNS